ncbi:uncharacterized protein METZ01_LOCUS181495, partial [marine metagenome]
VEGNKGGVEIVLLAVSIKEQMIYQVQFT